MLSTLSKDDRKLLLKFICAFAWADLEVQKQERQFVGRLVKKMKLDEEEAREVQGWLENPPLPEEVDPAKVPKKHRKVFLEHAKKLIESDGVIDEAEWENYELLEQLLDP